MDVVGIPTPGLGDTTYLAYHDGVGVLVDPQRDVGRFLAAAGEEHVAIRFVLETHVHNDYVSGGREAARRAGAELILPAGSGAAFRHTPAFHGEDLAAGSLTVRPMHTPGHTPEHCAYLVLVGGEPVALFSGGSLLVGAAGRTDLLGTERAAQLARLQFGSVRRLAALPEQVALYPTHGAGSFCSATAAGRAESTIGAERRTNPALAHRDEDAFTDAQLAGLQPYPSYYAHMAPINVGGPEPLPQLDVPVLAPAELAALPDAVVVDARPRRRYASGHLPGSLGLELRHDFATWVGWLVPFDSPLVLVLDLDQDGDEAVTQLARIGFDRVLGVVRGLERWRAEGRDLASFPAVTATAVPDGAQLLDVRSPGEWKAGHVAGSFHRYLPDLVDAPPGAVDPAEPVWVVCATGYRATPAAALLERHGLRPVLVADGGVADVIAHQAPVGR